MFSQGCLKEMVIVIRGDSPDPSVTHVSQHEGPEGGAGPTFQIP